VKKVNFVAGKMVKETFKKIILIFISLFLLVSSVLAEIQFHPLSQVTPIDTNLNMNTFNITNVNYLIYNTGIIAAGIRGIPTTDIQDLAVTGSKIADRAVGASKLSNPLAGPINVNGAINASYYYDFENSSYYLDLASTGYSLLVAGSVGIGTTSPIKKLDVVGDINATGYVYGLTGLCIGTDCKTSWSQVGGVGPWDNSTTQIFVREGYPSYVNASNTLFINGISGNVGIGTTSPSSKLEVFNGDIEINDAQATGTYKILGKRNFYAGDETQISSTSTSPEPKKQFTSVLDSLYGIKPRYINVIARIWNSGGYTTTLNVTLEGCAGTILTTTSTSPTAVRGSINVAGCSDGLYTTKVYLSTSNSAGTAYNDLIEFYYVE
jgi:hypothetical protein